MQDESSAGKRQSIILAAGCFWGVQQYFDQVKGVIKTMVGYTGGETQDPTYEAVCTGKTGHAEAVLIEFDNDIVHCETLLKHFFRIHDPTQVNRQGPDVGNQYRSAIFYTNDRQLQIAENIIEREKQEYTAPIATQLRSAGTFYPAEDYHQKFSEKTGRGMCHVAYLPQE